MKWYKLFELKRKLGVLWSYEGPPEWNGQAF